MYQVRKMTFVILSFDVLCFKFLIFVIWLWIFRSEFSPEFGILSLFQLENVELNTVRNVLKK